MIVYYNPRYNIDLGILNYLHLFNGGKFAKVYQVISRLDEVSIATVKESAPQAVIDDFVGDLMRRLLSSKRFILQALEVPYIPLLPFAMIDRRIFEPMR